MDRKLKIPEDLQFADLNCWLEPEVGEGFYFHFDPPVLDRVCRANGMSLSELDTLRIWGVIWKWYKCSRERGEAPNEGLDAYLQRCRNQQRQQHRRQAH